MMTFIKDPDATLDYGIDWTDWLPEGDSADTFEWVVPTGLTEVQTTSSGAQAAVWLSGGTPGENYEVTNRINTTAGRIADRSFMILVKNL